MKDGYHMMGKDMNQKKCIGDKLDIHLLKTTIFTLYCIEEKI